MYRPMESTCTLGLWDFTGHAPPAKQSKMIGEWTRCNWCSMFGIRNEMRLSEGHSFCKEEMSRAILNSTAPSCNHVCRVVCMHVESCMYVRMHARTHARFYYRMYACAPACMPACTYARLYACAPQKRTTRCSALIAPVCACILIHCGHSASCKLTHRHSLLPAQTHALTYTNALSYCLSQSLIYSFMD